MATLAGRTGRTALKLWCGLLLLVVALLNLGGCWRPRPMPEYGVQPLYGVSPSKYIAQQAIDAVN